MIRNETEYKKAVARLREESTRLQETENRFKGQGLKEAQIKRAMDPLVSFHLQLKEEVESYDNLKRGIFNEMVNFRGVGHLLVCLRIARGITQRELAEKLDVSESQVSRDERNEYHGITMERASKVLEALGVRVHSKVELPQLEVA